MLFSAAIQPTLPLRTNAAAEFVRQLVAGAAKQQPAPAPVLHEELPLDERVRLVGEW